MILDPAASFDRLVGPLPDRDHAGEVHGTTVLAVLHAEGAWIVADRRATMGSLIMFERARKIELLDPHTVVAISGAYARSLEVCRRLRHAFKYYERLNLAEMSAEGRMMEISRALSSNMGAAGIFLPIAAQYDSAKDRFGVHFFDTAGARFQEKGYACAGSGSERVRGAFEYGILRDGPWEVRPPAKALADVLEILQIAASLDSATGGAERAHPLVCSLTRDGARMLAEAEIEAA
jgi:proteasome beta subunit